MQGSVQLNAVGRGTILIDRHPSEEGRRVAVLGKRNYVPEDAAVAMSFRIEHHQFTFNGQRFDPGRICDVRAEQMTVADVLAGPSSEGVYSPVQDAIEKSLRNGGCTGVLPIGGDTVHPPWTTADLARACGRDSKDRMVRVVRDRLADEGLLTQDEDGGWWPQSTPSHSGGSAPAEAPLATPEEERDIHRLIAEAEQEEDGFRRFGLEPE
jgi:hypothetical protein